MERQEVEAPAADSYPRKIMEYMEGFLISKVGQVTVGWLWSAEEPDIKESYFLRFVFIVLPGGVNCQTNCKFGIWIKDANLISVSK